MDLDLLILDLDLEYILNLDGSHTCLSTLQIYIDQDLLKI